MTAVEPTAVGLPVTATSPHQPGYGAAVPRGWSVTTGRVAALGLLVLGHVVLAARGWVGPVGWVVGLTAGAVLLHLVDVGAEHTGRTRLSPADLVTLARAVLGCLVAALTVESLTGRPVTAPLVATAAVALALDAVDGPVARRTGTVSRFGARFDGETDAALILVLGVAAGAVAGWWLLAAGAVRYAFGAAGLVRPWMGATLPFRYWRKVVAAAAGIGLAVLASGLLPSAAALVLGLAVLGLLGESFGRDVLWLWRRRAEDPTAAGAARSGAPPRPSRGRRIPRRRLPWRRRGAHVLAAGLLGLAWCALLLPGRPDRLSWTGALRLPLEAVAVGAVLLLTPDRWRRVAAWVLGLALALTTLARLLDLGSAEVLDRPFDVVTDLSSLGPGLSFLRDSQGPVVAAGAVVAVGGLLALLLLGTPWALARTARAAARHRRRSGLLVVAAAAAWAVLAATGVRGPAGAPLAAADGAPYVLSEVTSARAALADAATFRGRLADDPLGSSPTTDLAALRGKDVLLVVVESYGRVALEGAASAPLRDQLDAATGTLAADGYGARSGWLTSSTFGAGSWFAHSTLQSGLWVDRQSRYDALLTSSRPTLSSVFARDGWRTVAVVPATVGSWPQGRAFYRFDQVYGRDDLGYAGPTFGFSTMPDQYTLAALQRLELSPRAERGGPPIMAQVELTSSHAPWAPLPTTVPAGSLGDGRVLGPVAARAESAARLWQDPSAVPAAYRTSVAYSLRSVVDFVAASHDDDLVALVVGDHQPSTVVTGPGAGRDVPVTVVAHDPAVLRAVDGWGWTPGLRPGAGAPVWPMDALRDRVLTTFEQPERGVAVSAAARGAPATADPAAAYVALRQARAAALGEEFVGQESFLTRTELIDLAGRAGVGAGTRVLDVCCGTGGPALFLVKHLGCAYGGVDACPASVARARAAAAEQGCATASFVLGLVPPLPPMPSGAVDVVLLLETLLAFRDRAPLLRAVAGALVPGGRFVVTAEVGRPLTGEERRRLPPGDTVWISPLATLLADLERAGLHPVSVQETTARHAETVEALRHRYEELAAGPVAAPGVVAARHLVATHARWSRWLHTGRVHTVAVVAEARPRRRPDTGTPAS